MNISYIKIALLVNTWLLLAKGIPIAMLQHPTSSQSIIIHPLQENRAAVLATTHRNVFNNSAKQPKYEYKYEVSDLQTGDRKSHWESREGDNVKGSYSLYEPDGAIRTVEYSADALHGFNAVVKRKQPSKRQYSASNLKNRNTKPKSTSETDYSGSTESFLSNAKEDVSGFSNINSSPRTIEIGFTVNHSIRKNDD